jgi:hypothetical protein
MPFHRTGAGEPKLAALAEPQIPETHWTFIGVPLGPEPSAAALRAHINSRI